MPLFSTQYLQGMNRANEEEERRRRAQEALASRPDANLMAPYNPALAMGDLNTPYNPDEPEPAAMLPEPVSARVTPLTAAGSPGGIAGPSYGARPQSRYEEIGEARDAYLQKMPGRGRSALSGALQGFLGGGGLIGAITGAATGAISPRTMRRQQFEQEIRPQIDERFRYEDADRAAGIAESRARQQSRLTEAQIANTNAEAYQRMQPKPVDTGTWVSTGRGRMVNNKTMEVRDLPPGLPETPAAQYRQGPDQNWYNVADEADRARIGALNAKLPRDKFGRFITRADERATAKANAPAKPKEDKDAKAMQRAVAEFNNTKQALNEATGRGDKVAIDQLRQKLQGMSANIASRYGSQYETGSGEWPYIKPRASRSSSTGLNAQQRKIFDEIRSEQPGASDDRILDYMRKKGLM